MSEEPKSFWKKPRKGTGSLWLAWLVLMVATLVISLAIFLVSGTPVTRLGEETVLVAAGEICVTIVFCLVLFIRWLCCWRNFRRFIFGAACFATAVALFYAEEDWRGWHAWQHYKQESEARGAKLDFKDFVPPPVPDDQNFALTPVVASSYAAMLDRTGHEIVPRNTNVVNRLEWDTSSPLDWNNAPTNADWAHATVTDLQAWQTYYRTSTQTNRHTGKVTNNFPVAPQPQSPAEDVLLALGKYGPDLEDLRVAAKLPFSRFPIEYDKENPAMILLPHLAAMKRCTLVIRLRAIAELQAGRSEDALADVELNFRLIEAIHSEPFIISQLVRYAMLNLNLQPVYEGLAEHRWTDQQLVELDAELAKLDCLADYENSIRGEPAAHIKLIDYMERNRGRAVEIFKMIDGFNNGQKKQYDLQTFWLLHLSPKGWFYQNELRLLQLNQQWNQPMVNATQRTVAPKTAAEGKEIEASLDATPFGFVAEAMLPWLGEYAQKAAMAQNATDMARVAVALERFWLAHGEYPETTDVLAPQYIAQMPHDVIGGRPLKYRRTANGRFILYSIGWNEKDDGGVAVFDHGAVDAFGSFIRDEGDWVWQYPAK